MNTSTKDKRLDDVELHLTPKQWAIKLASEMRRHASAEAFAKTIAKGTYRESPFVKPFYALADQAEQRWPGKKPADRRECVRTNQKLRTEFHALKTLIVSVNDQISKAGTVSLKATLALSMLQTLTLQEVFARTASKASAWIEEKQVADEKTVVLMTELRAYADGCVAEMPQENLPNAARWRHDSLLRDWADNVATLLLELVAYKAAVEAIQLRYFDNHPILFRDIEAAREKALQSVRAAIALLHKYQELTRDPSDRQSDPASQEAAIGSATPDERPGQLPIDVETIEKRARLLAVVIIRRWVTAAKTKATVDIKQEGGQHQYLLWQCFQESVGVKCKQPDIPFPRRGSLR